MQEDFVILDFPGSGSALGVAKGPAEEMVAPEPAQTVEEVAHNQLRRPDVVIDVAGDFNQLRNNMVHELGPEYVARLDDFAMDFEVEGARNPNCCSKYWVVLIVTGVALTVLFTT